MLVARRLFDDLTQYVEEQQLPWTPALRRSWLGYLRPGGYYVAVITLRREIEFAVKIPDAPERLGLANPYPGLKTRWDSSSRQWTWAVPTINDVPDVRTALNTSRKFQPETGPMPVPATPQETSTTGPIGERSGDGVLQA
jgi:hypothetical protein